MIRAASAISILAASAGLLSGTVEAVTFAPQRQHRNAPFDLKKIARESSSPFILLLNATCLVYSLSATVGSPAAMIEHAIYLHLLISVFFCTVTLHPFS